MRVREPSRRGGYLLLQLLLFLHCGGFVFVFREVLRSQHFYNTFITNYGWLVVIGSNLNLALRLLF